MVEKGIKKHQLRKIYKLYIMKTSSLLIAAAQASAISCDAPEKEIDALKDYAKHLGIVFQIRDDLLDLEGEGIKKDKNKDDTSIVRILGKGLSKAFMDQQERKARKSVAKLPNDEALNNLLSFAKERKR
jgi:geranylgeranyl diphosphate synthase type II